VQPIATWLVARPQNGVLGLALTLLFPLAPVVSGLVMAHLVFATGIRMPVIQGAVAGALLAVMAVVLSASVGQIVASAVTTWVPIVLLAGLARHWRSLTLTLQVSVIIAIVGVLAFYVVLGDPTEYWNEIVTTSAALFRESGLTEQADFLLEAREMIVPQMTMLFVILSWSLYVLVFLFGYALYQCLPGKYGDYGRFHDLNYGRVLAVIMAVTSLGAMATGAVWLQNTAFVVFAVFWLQVLVIAYALTLVPFVNVLLVVSLAVLGYTDAWFDFRARARLKDDRV
jgi:hypothetical protein